MTRRQVSIKEIAKLAGVSYPTVSRALRGEGRISEATRTRILNIARIHGYTPSLAARSLVSKRSYAVGLVLTSFTDPFHADIAEAIQSEANLNNYSVFMSSIGSNDPQRELEVVRRLQAHRVDGVIVGSGRVGDRYHELFHETGIPIVLINSQANEQHVYSICHDDLHGGQCMIEYLLSRGYTQIAYIGNAQAGKVNVDRYRAWHSTLGNRGLSTQFTCNGENGGTQDGVDAAECLLAAHWDALQAQRSAIWCFNDAIAIGALSVFHKHGLRVPQDIGIAGFDGLDLARFTSPALTTWRQPRHDMGVAAMQMVITCINNAGKLENDHQDQSSSGNLTVRGALVVGEST